MVPLGLSATALAHALGVTPARINDIVRGRRGITADTALRLARYFGTDAQSWINLQSAYDLPVAELAAGETIDRVASSGRVTFAHNSRTLPFWNRAGWHPRKVGRPLSKRVNV
jgi:addiction module HigA family antidote